MDLKLTRPHRLATSLASFVMFLAHFFLRKIAFILNFRKIYFMPLGTTRGKNISLLTEFDGTHVFAF